MMSAPEMVSATRAPNIFAVSVAAANYGMSRVLDRSITPTSPASSDYGLRSTIPSEPPSLARRLWRATRRRGMAFIPLVSPSPRPPHIWYSISVLSGAPEKIRTRAQISMGDARGDLTSEIQVDTTIPVIYITDNRHWCRDRAVLQETRCLARSTATSSMFVRTRRSPREDLPRPATADASSNSLLQGIFEKCAPGIGKANDYRT
jgi:hypothetical protein